jgi:undecaprenyl diphosphate synthase
VEKTESTSKLHVAIIMDGNGRWASKRYLPRIFGHQGGIKALQNILASCAQYGVRYLTVYAFSSENWQRPSEEVKHLMELVRFYFQKEHERMHQEGICIRILGDRTKLPDSVIALIDHIETLTRKNTRFFLQIALSYGGREEITRATGKIIGKVIAGELDPDDIDENTLTNNLDTAGLPDPDLLIRTGGEMRLSNYLLWQLCYTELFFIKKYWPDFSTNDLAEIIHSFYTQRQRRFGTINHAKTS